MLKLKRTELHEKELWEKAGITLPKFDLEKMKKNTDKNPVWVHFGAGNIFRAFPAALQQKLLNDNIVKEGIIAVETFDLQIIDNMFQPFDNLTMLALMKPNGSLNQEVIASVALSLKGNPAQREDYQKLVNIVKHPGLQMISFTITEKGYSLWNMDGEYIPVILEDMENGPSKPKHTMSIVAALLYERYIAGAHKIAVVSMDNCSHNGEKLRNSILAIAKGWTENNLTEQGFLDYIQNESIVSFPWTMIDKITPRPSKQVQNVLEQAGLIGMEPIVTDKNTFIAPFVNAEIPEYLVIEDQFPNGRPPLEKAGVYFTDRETVNKTETMKVTTCLNPLHTALAVFGCLLSYDSIAEEMKDDHLKKLVCRIGYEEGMPVVVNPGIIDPKHFIDEVIEKRLPNPYIPDTPQRIATDTSQKMAIRFGETMKAYQKHNSLKLENLKYIPLVIAAWLRYLLGVDDNGNTFERSPDPMLKELTKLLSGIVVFQPETYQDNLKMILKNETLFGLDLYQAGIGEQIESMFLQMIKETGAIRALLKEKLED